MNKKVENFIIKGVGIIFVIVMLLVFIWNMRYFLDFLLGGFIKRSP